MTLLPLALFLSAVIAFWVAQRTRGAKSVPGGDAFFCLMASDHRGVPHESGGASLIDGRSSSQDRNYDFTSMG